jgi:hypothetical protein
MIDNAVIPISQLQPRDESWLWPNRIALGKLAIFDGDPGRGKSLVTLDLCARVTTGRAMPDGTGRAEPANVIIIQDEDDADGTVLARLRALGADLDRVFVFSRDFLEEKGPFSLPSGIETLEKILIRVQPRLVVIDPIVEYLDRDVSANNEQSLRRALTPLRKLIAKHGCACILVRHLNKGGGPRALYRGNGSICFNAACRSSWLLGCDPDDPTRLIMAQNKINLSAPQESLAYRIVAEPGAAPTIEWLGPSPLSADQVVAGNGRKVAPLGMGERAEVFLLRFLDEAARPTTEIWEAAQEEGIGRRTLQRAARHLEIRSQRVWNGKQQLTYWLLDGQKLPESIPPEYRPDDISDLFAEERAKYPHDPLEDVD